MKSILFFLTLTFVFGFKSNAQTLTQSDIIGTWKVKKVNNLIELPKEQMQKMTMIKEAFLKAKFDFRSDKKFTFQIDLQGMKIKDAHWKYNAQTKTFIIQEWTDKETNERKLMEIQTKKVNNEVVFFLSESFFTLLVEKN